jgi:hypothetical protein
MYKGTPVAVKQWFNPDMTEAVLQEFRQEVRLHCSSLECALVERRVIKTTVWCCRSVGSHTSLRSLPHSPLWTTHFL